MEYAKQTPVAPINENTSVPHVLNTAIGVSINTDKLVTCKFLFKNVYIH